MMKSARTRGCQATSIDAHLACPGNDGGYDQYEGQHNRACDIATRAIDDRDRETGREVARLIRLTRHLADLESQLALASATIRDLEAKVGALPKFMTTTAANLTMGSNNGTGWPLTVRCPIRGKVCVCGCDIDDHGHDDEYQGSTACQNCEECIAFEADHDATVRRGEDRRAIASRRRP